METIIQSVRMASKLRRNVVLDVQGADPHHKTGHALAHCKQ